MNGVLVRIGDFYPGCPKTPVIIIRELSSR